MSQDNFTRRRFVSGAAAAGIFAPAIMRATIVNAREISQIAGQLLIFGIPGASAGTRSAKALAAHIGAGRAGGFLALRHNVKSKESLTGITNLILGARRDAFTAIDQEGGKVQRLSRGLGFTNIPTAQWVSGNLTAAKAQTMYEKAGRELRSAGFNLNLAPSVDIHQPGNPVIGKYGRSFGSDPAKITEFGGAFISGFSRAGVACAMKHFPGHGSSRSDSHDGVCRYFIDLGARRIGTF